MFIYYYCIHLFHTRAWTLAAPFGPQSDLKVQLRWLGLKVIQEKVLSTDRQKAVSE